ncbi:MAG TPA: CoA transferase [Candidatus Binataceae bacterium]|nr:CoA transferase [Candidatus Binataceae bacterium]
MSTIVEGKIRVLDLSMGWAGPLLGQMLAEMGAEVVKVEDTQFFDWWRGSLSMGPPEMQPIERASTFNTANRGKLGVTLDLNNPRGIEIVKRLVTTADILVENYSPGIMKRFGLDWEVLRPINPRLIMISMPSFGYGGPETNARGYGNTIEAMAGVTGLTRYHDAEQPYTLSNALGDPVSGLTGTFGVLAALHERERTGKGQWIELAQVEGAIQLVAGPILEYQLTGAVPRPQGNRNREFAPHGIYGCAGERNWLAVAAATDDQWRALTGALGLPHLAGDARFSEVARRKENEDALDAELRSALAALSIEDAMSRLRAAGVYAAPVNSAAAVIGDPQISDRGYFVAIDRAVVGTHLYPGAVARFPETPLNAGDPAPLLGEHNGDVFRRLLGMSEAEIEELEAAGVIGTRPRQYSKAS